MADKAIVGISDWSDTRAQLRTLARHMDGGETLPEADYHLNFASAAQLFSELTPARLALLETLKAIGPVSVYALAKKAERNYSNVHSDIQKLLEHELVSRDEAGKVFVPWDEVQIRLTLGRVA